ncbi:MAG: phosphoribosylamine--glycine ligase [Desulfomonile tiedjei]|uniref:Phosphoribosylamine--glycine ligase n=1 Tax=Desulfomonile tiedjei TaxID=2358 RepID=A0A9D6Z3Q3_9BACT|nr:phosphoribosylamine--glycine ligase [Desulfomonile tiedjei]
MKILIVGSGGREHTLAWKAAQSDLVTEIIVAPGNVGIKHEPKCRLAKVSAEDVSGLRDLAQAEKVDLTVVGPEAPLVEGLVDQFEEAGLKVFGPRGQAAALEGSKVFTKRLMAKYGIPTGEFEVFDDFHSAEAYLKSIRGPIVVKADGLAAGKGVFVCRDRDEAMAALYVTMKERAFGAAGDRVLIEECLEGEEASFIALTDGRHVLPLASSQDHKAIFDNDLGPNTGGMGAYSPAPVVTREVHDRIMSEVMIPTVRAMENEGIPYLGFLYAGLMIKDGIPRVLEFNARMGDPEAQPLLFRMRSDIVQLMMAAMEGRLGDTSIDWIPEDAVCVVMASGGYPGPYEKGKPITGIEDADALEGVKVFHAGTGDGSNGFVTAGGRVLGVTARALGIAEAIAKAYQAVEKIRWESVHYRRDIGKKALNRV